MAGAKEVDDPNIYIEAADVWAYAQEHKKDLAEKMVLIAENEDRGYEIYLTTEEHGYPFVCVFFTGDDESPVDEEPVVTKTDCKNAIERMYRKYLYTPRKISDDDEDAADEILFTLGDDEDPPISRAEAEGEIEEREDALHGAFMDFMAVVLEQDMAEISGVPEYENTLDEMLDRTLEMINNDFGVSVRRPSLLVSDETGEEFYSEYPYDDGYSNYPQ